MKNKGFTIVELMICVSIAGIVAAVVIPALRGAPVPVAGQETVRPLGNCN